MKIDWAALGVVAAASIAMSVLFTILLSSGIRTVTAARVQRNSGGGSAVLVGGYALLGLAGLLVLFGLWLIVPQLH